MTRRCSHCSINGHNSRACPIRGGSGNAAVTGGGVRLFGVRLTNGSIIKKSASMGNLSSAAAASNNPGSPLSDHDPNHIPGGYLSDVPTATHVSTNRRGDRKKGVPWTEEEHRLFLVGLQKLGKGDWRGIARNFVMSRTPTQVASHAQKYFNRQNNFPRRKRRSSLFDMIPDDMATDTPTLPEEQVLLPSLQIEEADNPNPLFLLHLSLNSEFGHREDVAQDSAGETKEDIGGSSEFTPTVHAFLPPYVPLSYPFWPTNPAPPDEDKGIEASQHQVLKPIPLLPKESVNVEDLLGMSQLRIEGTENGHRKPLPLSLKLPGEPSRQSAFHANGPSGGADLSNGKTGSIQTVLH